MMQSAMSNKQVCRTTGAGSFAGKTASVSVPQQVRRNVQAAAKAQKGRWTGLDNDVSDDQQDISRGKNMVDSLFQGAQGLGGTHNAVLSSTEYLSQAVRTFNNVEDGFYISPAFLDKMTIHIAKNFMELPKIKVPLILGIWGGKGQGKTFQVSLAYKKLGINPIVMSAGELESGNAGEPAKLIRQRYREASDLIKKGKMSSLFINDLDAGAGRMGLGTQYTVNNQMVNATLMNIADNPTNVQLPGVYKNEEIPRVPIICTGNDFSTLYAPLIRDGRMEKYYWNPTREDRIGICMGIFHEDNVDRNDVEMLVDAFPGQSIDFFGALRARVYDDKVREFIATTGMENLGKRLINSKDGKVTFEKPKMGVDVLMKYGRALVNEQENVNRVQLAEAYLLGAELAGSSGTSLPEGYDGLKGNLARDPVRKNADVSVPPPRAVAPGAVPASSNGSSNGKIPAAIPVPAPRAAAPAPAAPAASGAGGALSAAQLANLKIDGLMELCKVKNIAVGRNANRSDLTAQLLAAKASVNDLSKGMLVDMCIKMGLPSSGDVNAMKAAISGGKAPAPAAPAASYTPPAASYTPPAAAPKPAASAPTSGDSLSANQLGLLPIDCLMSLCRAKAVDVPRNPTREGLRAALAATGVTTKDLTKNQLVELCMKSGLPFTGSEDELRQRIKANAGGASSYSAPAASKPAAAKPTSSPSSSSKPASSSPAGDLITAQQLSVFKIDDLISLAKTKKVAYPRSVTKNELSSILVQSGLSLNDLSKGQLIDLCVKLGQPMTGDIETLKSRVRSATMLVRA